MVVEALAIEVGAVMEEEGVELPLTLPWEPSLAVGLGGCGSGRTVDAWPGKHLVPDGPRSPSHCDGLS